MSISTHLQASVERERRRSEEKNPRESKGHTHHRIEIHKQDDGTYSLTAHKHQSTRGEEFPSPTTGSARNRREVHRKIDELMCPCGEEGRTAEVAGSKEKV